jgi:hypothetical protein
MSRFGSLGAESIRIYATDRRDVEETRIAWSGILDRFADLVIAKLGSTSRLNPKQLSILFEEADALMLARYKSFAAIRRLEPATRARPKGEKREVIYLSLQHDAKRRIYSLFSFHLAGSCKKLRLNIFQLPFSFSEHAVQRVMERVKDQDEALRHTAESLIDWVLHLIPLAQIAQERNQGNMAIPAKGEIGLYLGEFLPQDEDTPALGVEWTQSGLRSVEPNKYLVNGPAYFIHTFVNVKLLRDEQITSMRLMTEYHQRNQTVTEELRNSLFWPDAILINKSRAPDHEERGQALSDEFVALFNDQKLLGGLKRSRGSEIEQSKTGLSIP